MSELAALQLLLPALVAALSSYVAVSVRLAKVETRQEERFEGLRRELQLRDTFVGREIKELRTTDDQLGVELARLRERVR